MRSTALAVHVPNRKFADRCPIPRCQSRNEAMQFPVKRHLVDDLPTVCLEGCAEVVYIDAAQLRHQPVRTTRGKAPHNKVVDALLAPPADDVVTLTDLLEKCRNVIRIVLQIAVHGDHIFPCGMIETRGQSRSLPEITSQLYDCHAAVDGGNFAQQMECEVGASIV